jgi:hypothetical protein
MMNAVATIPTRSRRVAAVLNPLLTGSLAAAFLIGSASPLVAAEDLSLPDGWRQPTAAEVAQPWRDGPPDRNLVARADFDGDGTSDIAAVLFSKKQSSNGTPAAIGLFFWSGADSDISELHVQNGVLEIDVGRVGVDVLPAGRHTTACGAGFWECASDEPEQLMLEHPAILYFHHGSVSAAFFRTKSDSAFRSVSMGD